MHSWNKISYFDRVTSFNYDEETSRKSGGTLDASSGYYIPNNGQDDVGQSLVNVIYVLHGISCVKLKGNHIE